MQANWVKLTTATTGTGTVTLSSVASFAGLVDWFSDGALVEYAFLDASGNPIESGIGTYSAGGNTLARSWVQATIIGGVLTKDGTTISPANLSGVTTVIVTKFAGVDMPGIHGHYAPASGLNAVLAASDGASMSGGAATANRLSVAPFCHRSVRRLRSLKLWCGTPSGNAKIGVWRLGLNGYPTQKLIDSGSFALAGGYVGYTPAVPIWMPPGWYAVGATVDNGTATFRTINSVNSRAAANPFGVTSNGYVVNALYLAGVFATLPDPFTASATPIAAEAANDFPAVYWDYES